MSLSRVVLAFALHLPVFAQAPNLDLFRQAPPAVDAALRERIAGFYQAHVDGKFRDADQYVAEDTKDFFFERSKPRYLSFEIQRIDYTNEQFTAATATMLVEQNIMVPGFAGKPVKIPVPSHWKVESDGQWYWWVDQSKLNVTPFGEMKPGPGARTGRLPDKLPTVEDIHKAVRANREAVALSASMAGLETVEIANGLPGPVRLELAMGQIRGISASLDKTSLASGETAVLTFNSEGSVSRQYQSRMHLVTVRVHPTNQTISLKLTVGP
ncbi:MAG: hypothetical protein IPM24_05160 [Bryobacterales bacterium]|nr:hypothetical protein [Bryobacterales bacterium]